MSSSSDIRMLSELKPGQAGRVVRVVGECAVRHRLLEMGLTSGTKVTYVRRAPLGDPIELSLRGYRLSVRKSEASSVIVESE